MSDLARTPTAISLCDAEDGSSDRESLSSCSIDAFQNEQIESMLSLHDELIPFFEVWDKIQCLPHDEYLSFCSLFYLNLSSDFVAQNADGFFDSTDPSKSGEFILRQITSTVIKMKDIYKLLSDSHSVADRYPDSHSIAAAVIRRHQTFTSKSPSASFRYETGSDVATEHKVEALRSMERFRAYWRIHSELGIQDSMFGETANALEMTFDDIAGSDHSKRVQLEELSLSQRGAVRVFFEIVRALMLQHDLSSIRNMVSSEGDGLSQCDVVQSVLRNTESVQRFLAFWDEHFVRSMNDCQRQLFSLRIYSFMVQRLQDRAAGKYQTATNTPSHSVSADIDNADHILLESLSLNPSSQRVAASLNASLQEMGNESLTGSLNASSMTLGGTQSMNGSFLTVPGSARRSRADIESPLNAPYPLRDEDVMSLFHRHESFVTSFSVGIVSWLNYLLSFLRENEPKRLSVELRNTRKTYKRMGIDVHILSPLLFAFKSSCFGDGAFYRETTRRSFHRSKHCVIDEELEESIDFVLSLFLSELVGERDAEFTAYSVDPPSANKGSPRLAAAAEGDSSNTFTSRCSPRDLSTMGHRLAFNSPTISPKKRLRQNVYSSLLFWRTSIQIEGDAVKQNLSDRVYEAIARSAPQHQRDVIHSLSATMDRNVDIIDVLDRLIRKIGAHSQDIKAPKRFAFMMGHEMESGMQSMDHIERDIESMESKHSDRSATASSSILNQSETSSTGNPSNRARSVHHRSPEMQRAIKNKPSRRHSAETASSTNIVVDFVSFQHDEEIRAMMELTQKHPESPMVFKLFRTAIISVFSKYYPQSFDNVTKRNFTILLRTMSSLFSSKSL